ncbi:hypothetical protein PJL18_01302 [Paenarthrobacter nicotinovorans]|nr:hypothetical protein [Paenarthrobacter nicotinovorans]
MAVTVKDHDVELVDLDALGLGDEVQVLLDGQAQIHHVGGLGTRDELLHVEDCGGVEHGAALSDCQHCEGVVDAQGGEAGSVDGIDGDVALGTGAVTNLLAVEQHGGFVFFAFTNHHDAVEVDGVKERTHGVDGGTVGFVLVAETYPVAAGNCRGFGDADEFKRKVAVGFVDADGERRRNRGILLGHWCRRHLNLFFE